jgi:hypothetical protein
VKTRRPLHAFVLVTMLALTYAVSTASTSVPLRPMRFFDSNCKPGQRLHDDPLKFPGMTGASHEHQFLGNTSTNAFSTGASLLQANSDGKHTTCRDPKDGSAYWLPALYQDGKRLDPGGIKVYYRANQQVRAPMVQPFPVGFGQIAGPNTTDWRGEPQLGHEWRCVAGDDDQRIGLESIDGPYTCSTGKLRLAIHFRECWDGVNKFKLDESHVVYQSSKGCPADHPVLLPRVGVLMSWSIDTKPHRYQLALAADGTLGSTATAHADFFSGWDPQHLQDLVTRCMNTYPQNVQPNLRRPNFFVCNQP